MTGTLEAEGGKNEIKCRDSGQSQADTSLKIIVTNAVSSAGEKNNRLRSPSYNKVTGYCLSSTKKADSISWTK